MIRTNFKDVNNVGRIVLKKIQPGDELGGRTYASPKQIQDQLKDLDIEKFKNYCPYTYKDKLFLPGVDKYSPVAWPGGFEFLPVSTPALNTITKHLIAKYHKHANKELSFVNDGSPRIEFVQVTLLGTGLGLYYNQETGTPMGK